MSQFSELPNSKPPKFFSLFVPQKPDWFNGFLTQKVQELLERKKAKVFAQTEKRLAEQSKKGEKALTKEEQAWLEDRLSQPKRRLDMSKREPGSLSDYLIDLVVHDLRDRKILTKKELEAYTAYAEAKPDILRTQFKTKENHVHSTFSLYLPSRKDQSWIRSKLETEFIKENCHVKSRSIYIWDLFIRENAHELTKAQLGEWERAISTEKTAKAKKSA